jgi:hypothetical protein
MKWAVCLLRLVLPGRHLLHYAPCPVAVVRSEVDEQR